MKLIEKISLVIVLITTLITSMAIFGAKMPDSHKIKSISKMTIGEVRVIRQKDLVEDDNEDIFIYKDAPSAPYAYLEFPKDESSRYEITITLTQQGYDLRINNFYLICNISKLRYVDNPLPDYIKIHDIQE